MNVLNAIGRVGKDPELRYTPQQKPVLKFSLALGSGYGQNKTTTWLTVSLWGDRAQKLSEMIAKGDRIGVTGEISLREYEKDGQKRSSLELNASNVTLLGNKAEPESKPAKTAKPAASFADMDDSADIPF